MRRFEGAKEVFNGNQYYLTEDVQLKDKERYNLIFDKNSITPGTKFMERLDNFIRTYIKYKMSTDEVWKRCTVIYSDHKVPGEGEQKIMEYIRIHQGHNYNKDYKHVIYSPDADLIFLGLTLQNHNVRIMREDEIKKVIETDNPTSELALETDFRNMKFIFVEINKMRNSMVDAFINDIGETFDSKRFIRDFIFLCFTVGNDFLPCSPAFEIRTNAIEKIRSIYVRSYKETKSYIVTDSLTINYKALIAFFRLCAAEEDANLEDKRDNLIRSRERMNRIFDEDVEFLLDNEFGKKKYYKEKMNLKNQDDLLSSCLMYVKGMEWICKYYFDNNCPSWNWYYPNYYAPFMKDLCMLDPDIVISFAKSVPCKAYETLLLALPSVSMHLLPERLRKFYFDNESIKLKSPYCDKIDLKSDKGDFKYDYIEIYNSLDTKNHFLWEVFDFSDLQFKTDDFQKIMDWQAVPILPKMEIDKVKKFYNEESNNLDLPDLDRNLCGLYTLYTCDEEYIKKHSNLIVNSYDYCANNIFCGKIFRPCKFDKIGDKINIFDESCLNLAMEYSFDQRYRQFAKRKKH
ncbi:XRN4 [Hepatospora eriocheir]|uniref:XRN4 n=1 Tax=Hepatospora eriocheir TaxID=1081669 RepID=A0A1X0QLF0_9MICR|nr:XRN4 [Hepatospora eriocheir]